MRHNTAMAAAISDHRAPPPALDERCALFLDVDGTLLEFAATPDGVALPPYLLDTLQAWSERLDGALALVSGRPLAQLDRLFAPLRLPAAGLHGQERRGAGERVDAVHDPAPIRRIRDEAALLARLYEGVLVEDKGVNLALHWRAAPRAAGVLQAYAEEALTRLPGYRLQPGDQVLEFVPLGVDKGAAVSAFLRERPFRGRTPVFVGDDFTDEYGFAVVNGHGGRSVIVGGRVPTVATHHLADPGAVIAWLRAGLLRPADAGTTGPQSRTSVTRRSSDA